MFAVSNSMTIIFDGKKLAAEKERKLTLNGISPKLVSILVGDNSASRLYLKVKEKACQRVGIGFEKKEFSADANEREIKSFIEAFNKDPKITGIMAQLPLPKNLEIVGAIAPTKDVDCLTPENLGLLMTGRPRFLPATVKAIMEIIKLSNFQIENLKGKNICVVGASNIIGKPLAMHLKNLGATVILCDEYTKNLAKLTKQAEILISATGVAGLIKKEMVKKGAVVVDVGSPKGDVDFKNVAKVASFITPVPGGIGPLTVVCLLENLLQAAGL